MAGWSGLQIVATSRGGAPVDPLRREQLSVNTLLAVFDQEIVKVSICQPEETLHFGLGDAATTWQLGRRVVDITGIGSARRPRPRPRQRSSPPTCSLDVPPKINKCELHFLGRTRVASSPRNDATRVLAGKKGRESPLGSI